MQARRLNPPTRCPALRPRPTTQENASAAAPDPKAGAKKLQVQVVKKELRMATELMSAAAARVEQMEAGAAPAPPRSAGLCTASTARLRVTL